MTKRILIYIPFIWFSCAQTNCPEDINKRPMFGRVKKCREQLDADKDFLKECDKNFKSRREAAQFHVDKGWGYFYENEFETAMKRFNQAWLLDSLNADVYWGFGNILGMQRDFKQSLVFLEQSLKMNSSNPRVWESASTSYGQLFYETKDIKLLDKSIEYLKASIKLEPNNARAYGQLTAAYSYFMQKDSARKYLRITDKLDPSAVNPDVRKILSKN